MTATIDFALQNRLLELLALVEGIPETINLEAHPETGEWEALTHLLQLQARLAAETRTLYWQSLDPDYRPATKKGA